MPRLSPAIALNFTPPPTTAPKSTNFFSGGGGFRLNFPIKSTRVRKSGNFSVSACAESRNPSEEIDLSDPDWKNKYQQDFEQRFNLPHLTDFFKDLKPRPSTFCLKMRSPMSEDFSGGYPSDEKWNGYIKNNYRVLLKIVITLDIYGVKNIVGIPFGYRGFTDKGLKEMPISLLFQP